MPEGMARGSGLQRAVQACLEQPQGQKTEERSTRAAPKAYSVRTRSAFKKQVEKLVRVSAAC